MNIVGIACLLIWGVVTGTGDGCWGDPVTKSGARASMPRLPGISAAAGSDELTTPSLTTRDVDLWAASSSGFVGLHEPVFADLMVSSRHVDKFVVDLGPDKIGNLELTMTRPNGKTVVKRLEIGGISALGRVTLDPHGSFRERLLLNRWENFAQEGVYHVKITLLAADGGATSARPYAAFSVRMNARNPSALTFTCESLVTAAIFAPTLAQRMAAARTLSYVDDNLAVPSLIRVLRHGSLVEDYAIEGLGRVRDKMAISALADAARHHPDPEIRGAANSMLAWIQSGLPEAEPRD